MRIAIVGTGIAGLTVAHHLHREHELALFEAADWIGGHTHTVSVQVAGRDVAVDTGFIVYNEQNYPHFCRLLDELGVASQPSDMTFSVRCERSGLEYGTRNANALLARRSNLLRPSFQRMVRDVLRFQREARRLLAEPDEKVSLGDWLAASRYSQAFVEHHLVPMGAAIWSAEAGELGRFPALRFVRFFENHGLLSRHGQPRWRVIRGGSARYVEALVAPFRDRIRLASPVREVCRRRDGVEVETARGGRERFDRVVLATHSDQALDLLADPSDAEFRLLSAIRYQTNEVVLHTDASILPRRRRAWASWNVRVPPDRPGRVAVTYHMNRLQSLDLPVELCVTLNETSRIDPRQVLGRWITHHPILDGAAARAQALRERISGPRCTHYCGAWWGYGFHEDGVASGLAVVREIPAVLGVKSALYTGRVRHRRETPVAHAFAYRLFLLYLDLAELDGVFAGRWLWSVERPNWVSFRRRDHLGDPARPLDACVRELVETRCGWRPEGPIRLLTQPRVCGYVFNPVSFLYCFDARDERIEAIVADVTNTPWKERHAYVLRPEPGAPLRFETPKGLHVSPFMGMEQRYRFRFGAPGERLHLAISSHEAERRLFHASLDLRRRPLDGPSLARALVLHPLQPARLHAAIYWQALRLHRKGVPQHPHPGGDTGADAQEAIRA